MANQLSLSLQSGAGNQQVSSLAITVAIHAAIGAALLFGVTRTMLPPRDLPPVNVLSPQVNKPIPLPELRSALPEMRAQAVSLPPLPDVRTDTQRDAAITTDRSVVVSLAPNPSTGQTGTTGEPASTRGSMISARGDVGVACPNARDVQSSLTYPAMARRNGVQGDVVARFVVDAQGAIRDITIVSTASALLNRTVHNAIADFRCIGQGRDVAVEIPFAFRLRD